MLAVSLTLGGTAGAEVILYGTASGFGTGEQGSGGSGGGMGPGTGPGNFSQFFRIDHTTGVAFELSQDVGYGGDVNGLAIDPSDEIFAGTGGRGPNTLGRVESPSLLFTIDPKSGVGNPEIGPMGIEFGPPDSAGQGPGAGNFQQFGSRRNNVAGLTWDPLADQLIGMTGRGSQLFSADPATGLATRIGTPCDSAQIGAPGGFCRRGNAVAIDDVGVNDPVGTLFWANDIEVAELDRTTGLIVGNPVALDFSVFGPPTDPDAPFRVVAMDYHPLTGDLYAAVQQRQGQDSPPPRSTLAILNPRAGSFTIVGAVDSTGAKIDGIAFTSPDFVPPPECSIELSKRRYTDGDLIAFDVLRLANPRASSVAVEVKMWVDPPGIAPVSLFIAGADGSVVLAPDSSNDVGPISSNIPVSPAVARGRYEVSCRLLDPVTGELLAEDRNFFDIVDPPPPISFMTEDWALTLDEAGPGIHGIFMIGRVEPLTPAEIDAIGGKLVWDQTEVQLCTDPTFPPVISGELITIREFGNDGVNYVNIGDGFESNIQAENCPINAQMEAAFNDFGLPTEACIQVSTGGVDYEFCAPLEIF